MVDSRDLLPILISYLLGAIPFSHLVARWRAEIDIRDHGEGNVGARNVFHVVGPAWGALAALLDTGKGLAAYLVAGWMAAPQPAVLACGFAAPLGHNYSPFLRFRGGKGLATTMGFLLGLFPWSTLAGGLLIGLLYWLTRDANKALVLGIPGTILLPPLFGAPLWSMPYVLCLFLVLGVKKIVDRPHERAVWTRDPWQKGAPGLYREARKGAEKEKRPRL